jgi:hypothetical protein
LPPLDSNPTHGILPAEEYIPAKLDSLFSNDAYRAFNIGRNVGKVGFLVLINENNPWLLLLSLIDCDKQPNDVIRLFLFCFVFLLLAKQRR